ncbi:nuclear transport factor 2 family protein [Pseudonocardia sp. CA-107938]|uniref:nuclear transport factor 2 family protein n=1 Tax=Pseudonocardia sp. CA-107938 TaxID=3240021 RepID=UPI003D94141D
MSTTEEVLDALSAASRAGDREAIRALFAADGAFWSGTELHQGPDAAADALVATFRLLATAAVERVRRFVQGEEAYAEFVLTGTTHDGQDVRAHYCDYVHVRDGKILLKSTFHKAPTAPR